MNTQVLSNVSKCNVDVSNHFLQTLNKYEIKQSGLYFHLSYRSAYLSSIIHKEHNYAKQSTTYNEDFLKPTFPTGAGDKWHLPLVPVAHNPRQEINIMEHSTSTDSACNTNLFSDEKTHSLLILLTQSQGDTITVKLPELNEEKLNTSNQYIDVAQGSPEWLACRIGVITASKLPSLLGFNGNKEFDSSWFYILNKVDESTYSLLVQSTFLFSSELGFCKYSSFNLSAYSWEQITSGN